jgi:hypothetical protein
MRDGEGVNPALRAAYGGDDEFRFYCRLASHIHIELLKANGQGFWERNGWLRKT